MKKSMIASLLVSLGLSLSAVACGDDDEDVEVDVPGVKVNADALTGAAGSAAKTDK